MPMMGRQRRGGLSLNQLVAQDRPLPLSQARGQTVGTPAALPGVIPYGPQPQGLEQSSRFTGGQTPGGSFSLTHPEQPPTFQEPQFAQPPSTQMQPMSPLLLAIAAGALGGGPIGGPGGAAPPPGPPAPPVTPPSQRGPLGTPGTLGPQPPGREQGMTGGSPGMRPGPQPMGGDLPRLQAAPGTGPTPLRSLAALLASVGKRGVYQS